MIGDRALGLVDLVERDALQRVCATFHDLFGLSVRVFASDGTPLAEALREEPLCAYLRGLGDGQRRCNELRAAVRHGRAATGGEGAVTCFSGCVYHPLPVLFDGEPVGRVVFGPFLPVEMERFPAPLFALDPGIDRVRLAEAAEGTRRVGADVLARIAAAVSAILDLILHSGHRAAVVSETHLAAIQESFREISEKNRVLQETTDRLRELDRLKSNFLAAVSHELRTPLTSIIGYSEMLTQGLGGDLGDEQRQFVQTILEKGEHLLGLISAVLDIATLDAGRLTVERTRTDLPGLCARAVERVQAQSGRRDVRIVPEVPRVPLPPVDVDPDLMGKALGHLIDNAVKYSPPSGVVDISFRVTEPEPEGESAFGFVLRAPMERHVEVAIRDRGPGIAAENRERIFEPFYQVDGSATRTHGGLGLGLALVRQFVEAHGGRVTLEAAGGGGSLFRVLLPAPHDAGGTPPHG
jgi:signal transduction histidine kinase